MESSEVISLQERKKDFFSKFSTELAGIHSQLSGAEKYSKSTLDHDTLTVLCNRLYALQKEAGVAEELALQSLLHRIEKAFYDLGVEDVYSGDPKQFEEAAVKAVDLLEVTLLAQGGKVAEEALNRMPKSRKNDSY